MAKPMIHAKLDVKRYGGKVSDYLPIHDFMDSSKAHIADHRHRALYHNSNGPFLCERIFGHVIINADGREVSVRDIAEKHIIDDLGWIPSVQDYLCLMQRQEWMGKRRQTQIDLTKFKIHTANDKDTILKDAVRRDRQSHQEERESTLPARRLRSNERRVRRSLGRNQKERSQAR